ncbi:tol-pal system protein YbgF [bacterium]|nr:tol-pal system protein YbgF [bacterium]
MKAIGFSIVIGIGWLCLAGCASRKEVVKFKEDLAHIQVRLTAIQSENEKMRMEIEDLGRSIQALRDDSHQSRADLLSEMSSLKSSTMALQSLLDDTGTRMSRLIHSVESGPSADTTRSMRNKPAASNIKPKELYQTAYLDLSRRNYSLALIEFQEYLKRFPDGEFADNAQYWIGEIYYAQGDYGKALGEFAKVVSQYPRGKKTPAAYLKMGYCQIQKKNLEEAKRLFNLVIQNAPQSEEAQLARDRIKGLE